jgi:hypothetical protein
MRFNVDERFPHGLTLAKAAECLKTGVRQLQDKYPGYIESADPVSQDGLAYHVKGKHFNLTIVVGVVNVVVSGTEDLLGHAVHGKVADLIREIFHAQS